MANDSKKIIVKVILVGEAGVGKTSLLKRFESDVFEGNEKPTVGVEFKIIKKIANGNAYALQIWDTVKFICPEIFSQVENALGPLPKCSTGEVTSCY
jgi:GTPase SAR1 family protein